MKQLLKLSFLLFGITAMAQTALYIPDTISGSNINLLIHKDSVQFLAGRKTKTYGFNSNKYLGSTIILNSGSNVNFTVNNQMGDTTTVHWHGLHVAPTNDGNPHTTILPSAIWTPSFTVMDKASTYWYHPHFHGKTATHVVKGLAGMIIVRDTEERALTLPRTYGIDDIPVIVQSMEFDSVNQIIPRGMQDSMVLVNGARANYGYSVYANLPAQVVRLRLLNAGGERGYNFGLSGNKPFKIIGTDGGLLQAPVNATRIMLASGERAEILIDLTGMNGQTIYLMSYASEIPMGVQGGPTMPMGAGSPSMDSPINGIDYNVMQINVTVPTTTPIPVTSIPTALASFTPYMASQANTIRTITMTPISMMSMDGPFYFNGLLFDMMRIDYKIPLNNIEIWELKNETMVAHPFHIHDVQFYILDRDGNLPALQERGRKDVVLVNPNETVRFIAKFEDFADSLNPYMFHCHILMHEDDGMMGQFVVMPPTSVGVNEVENSSNIISVYPNPTNGIVNITTNGINELKIYNVLGELIYTENKISTNELQINTSQWSRGIYNLSITNNNKTLTKKLIVN